MPSTWSRKSCLPMRKSCRVSAITYMAPSQGSFRCSEGYQASFGKTNVKQLYRGLFYFFKLQAGNGSQVQILFLPRARLRIKNTPGAGGLKGEREREAREEREEHTTCSQALASPPVAIKAAGLDLSGIKAFPHWEQRRLGQG